jgi:AcrR family transcriptional regulator
MAGRPQLVSSEERRERIEAVAARVFGAKGFADTRIDEIVELSGVSKPALYREYASKSHLFAAVIERHAALRAASAVRAFSREGSIHDRLVAMIEAWFVEVEKDPTSFRLAALPVPNDEVIASSAAARHALQIRHDVQLIRAFVPNVPDSEVQALGEVVRGALVTLASWWLLHPEVPRSVPVDVMVRLCDGLIATNN